jgi:hypothetical protein
LHCDQPGRFELPSLDERIAALLASPNDQPSIVFSVLLAEVDKALSVAERECRDAQARAYDPAILDATAVGRAHDTEYKIQRLKNATTALTAHHAAALNREAKEAWNKSVAPVRQRNQ